MDIRGPRADVRTTAMVTGAIIGFVFIPLAIAAWLLPRLSRLGAKKEQQGHSLDRSLRRQPEPGEPPAETDVEAKSPPPWSWAWLVALIVTGIPVAILLFLAMQPEKTAEEKLRDELTAAFEGYWQNYTIPAVEAAMEVQHLCEYVQPDPSVTDCDRYVRRLAELNSDLKAATSRLVTLNDEIQKQAAGVALTDKDRQALSLLVDLMKIVETNYEGDRILIEGWNDRDFARWSEGWEMRRKMIADWRALAERARMLRQYFGQ